MSHLLYLYLLVHFKISSVYVLMMFNIVTHVRSCVENILVTDDSNDCVLLWCATALARGRRNSWTSSRVPTTRVADRRYLTDDAVFSTDWRRSDILCARPPAVRRSGEESRCLPHWCRPKPAVAQNATHPGLFWIFVWLSVRENCLYHMQLIFQKCIWGAWRNQ